MSEMWQYTATAALLQWSVLIWGKDKRHETRVHSEINTITESSAQSRLKVRKECEFDLGKTKTICTNMRAPKLYNMLSPHKHLMEPKYLTNCRRIFHDFPKSYG